MPQSMRELKYLNSHRHDNILSLYGYSVTDSVACLVYQYMANGSLEDRLLCKVGLSFNVDLRLFHLIFLKVGDY